MKRDLREELLADGMRLRVVDGVELVRCPHCLMLVGPKEGEVRASMPKAGDVNLCMGCYGVSFFVEDRTLRRATAAEVRREVGEHPDLLPAGLSACMRERVLGGGSAWSEPEATAAGEDGA